ncbi:hypothetical protein EJC49_19025 [Aquibium carbonis]|uniref:Uncharacterized protein n=1 Tax=Aquibium carbonis TaxID=2495581 RepID=A0A3R9ZYK3_9HYPH|nr:hypothetical protein [Aquibium carbonis]RST84785.1 hypothetical protein EJC49_19025 [Aquibium carbonis]
MSFDGRTMRLERSEAIVTVEAMAQEELHKHGNAGVDPPLASAGSMLFMQYWRASNPFSRPHGLQLEDHSDWNAALDGNEFAGVGAAFSADLSPLPFVARLGRRFPGSYEAHAFVRRPFRGQNIGSHLVRQVAASIDQVDPTAKVFIVAHIGSLRHQNFSHCFRGEMSFEEGNLAAAVFLREHQPV